MAVVCRVSLMLVVLLLPASAMAQTSSARPTQPAEADQPDESDETPQPKEHHNFWERLTDPRAPQYRAALDRARGAFLIGDFEGLERALAELNEIKPKHFETRYFRALWLQETGDLDGAKRLLLGLLDDSRPTLPREILLAELGLIYVQQGLRKEAIEVFEEATRLASRNDLPTRRDNAHVYLANTAELYMASGDLDTAVALYRRALGERPDYLHALFGMAMVTERLGKRDDARGYLIRGLLLDPSQRRFDADRPLFAHPADEHFLAGLVDEELGRPTAAADKLEKFVEEATTRDHPFLEAGARALSRVESARPTMLGQGPLPVYRPTAAAADPRGRFFAVGDDRGRLVVTNLAARKVHWVAALSGTPITSLAFLDDGTLAAGRSDGHVRLYNPATQKRGVLLGPVALPSGVNVESLSGDGTTMLISSGRKRLWGIARADDPKTELGRIKLDSMGLRDVAVSRWHERARHGFATFLSTQGDVLLERVPDDDTPLRLAPLSSRPYTTMALTRNSHRLVAVGAPWLVVARTADMRVLRLVDLVRRDHAQKVVIDPKGAAGYGPAVIVLSVGRFAAYRVDEAVEPSAR